MQNRDVLPDRSTCAGCEAEVDRLRAALYIEQKALVMACGDAWLDAEHNASLYREKAREALNGDDA